MDNINNNMIINENINVVLCIFSALFLCVDSPRSTSIAVLPAGQLSEGDSVTLTCRSDAAPPVESFAWFKGKNLLGFFSCQSSINNYLTSM